MCLYSVISHNAADREAQTETVRVMMYDTVWHYGCKWMCLVSGTTDEPKYGAAGWAMVEGNPDFSIDIESSNGWYFDAERFATTLTNTLMHKEGVFVL